MLTFSFCCLIYGNYYRLTKTYKVSRASQTNCGPAKPDFGWPDWPAKEKVKLDPWEGGDGLSQHGRETQDGKVQRGVYGYGLESQMEQRQIDR